MSVLYPCPDRSIIVQTCYVPDYKRLVYAAGARADVCFNREPDRSLY